MSIVGTRPPLISERNLYEPHLELVFRHQMEMTGLISSQDIFSMRLRERT